MSFDPELRRRCWFLAGPTACGKSAAGIELAKRIDAEILSLDSMAVYRGMDVGTAKPPEGDRCAVPHHLIDLVDPDQNYSVTEYLSDAEDACRAVLSRGRVPLFVGGTGLYLRSLLRGLFEGPGASSEIRQRLERDAATRGAEALHARLHALDPFRAAKVHPNDLRRVVRALEVIETAGRPMSELQVNPALPEGERARHVYWLSPPREWLYQSIERRVDRMLADGLLEETRRLRERFGTLSLTALQAIGYRELVEHLEGQHTLDEAVELIKRHTRQFAKRQHTWFRNLEECRVTEISGEETPAEVAEQIIACGTG
ncbi:MAG: tRNA (adenosine(37)-N6)-dimethylallyltransferase MiaA [Planctomycetota bacterium]|nr:tRNA (adenosine(37)-N6)-dimethylallyltransferase MiaA [Planctomycetota bacterium]